MTTHLVEELDTLLLMIAKLVAKDGVDHDVDDGELSASGREGRTESVRLISSSRRGRQRGEEGAHFLLLYVFSCSASGLFITTAPFASGSNFGTGFLTTPFPPSESGTILFTGTT